MKAIVLHGPGAYSYEKNWKEPQAPDGWALVQVRYSGICGSDLPRYGYAGSYRHPMILGHEFSGTLAETGAPVAVLPIIPCGVCSNCRDGMGPFYCSSYQFIGSRNDGGHAEFCAVPVENLFKLPSDDSLKHGALVEPMAVGLHVARRSGFRPGKTAAVIGAGPIGLLVAFWLKTFGARTVMISDIRDKNLKIAREAGFAETFDPANDLLPANAFDYAYEAAGSSKAIESAIHMLKPGGTLTVVGRDTGDTVIPLKSFEALMRKEITLKGCFGYDMKSEHEYMAGIFTGKTFPLDLLISHEVSLEDAPGMIGRMCGRSVDFSKVLIKM